MICYYIFKVQYCKGSQYFIVNYLVSYCDITRFIHFLEKKSSSTIIGIYDYHKYPKTFCCKTWFV